MIQCSKRKNVVKPPEQYNSVKIREISCKDKLLKRIMENFPPPYFGDRSPSFWLRKMRKNDISAAADSRTPFDIYNAKRNSNPNLLCLNKNGIGRNLAIENNEGSDESSAMLNDLLQQVKCKSRKYVPDLATLWFQKQKELMQNLSCNDMDDDTQDDDCDAGDGDDECKSKSKEGKKNNRKQCILSNNQTKTADEGGNENFAKLLKRRRRKCLKVFGAFLDDEDLEDDSGNTKLTSPRLRLKHNLRKAPQRQIMKSDFKHISPEFYGILSKYENEMAKKYPLYGIPMSYWSETVPCCSCEERPKPEKYRLGDEMVTDAKWIKQNTDIGRQRWCAVFDEIRKRKLMEKRLERREACRKWREMLANEKLAEQGICTESTCPHFNTSEVPCDTDNNSPMSDPCTTCQICSTNHPGESCATCPIRAKNRPSEPSAACALSPTPPCIFDEIPTTKKGAKSNAPPWKKPKEYEAEVKVCPTCGLMRPPGMTIKSHTRIEASECPLCRCKRSCRRYMNRHLSISSNPHKLACERTCQSDSTTTLCPQTVKPKGFFSTQFCRSIDHPYPHAKSRDSDSDTSIGNRCFPTQIDNKYLETIPSRLGTESPESVCDIGLTEKVSCPASKKLRSTVKFHPKNACENDFDDFMRRFYKKNRKPRWTARKHSSSSLSKTRQGANQYYLIEAQPNVSTEPVETPPITCKCARDIRPTPTPLSHPCLRQDLQKKTSLGTPPCQVRREKEIPCTKSNKKVPKKSTPPKVNASLLKSQDPLRQAGKEDSLSACNSQTCYFKNTGKYPSHPNSTHDSSSIHSPSSCNSQTCVKITKSMSPQKHSRSPSPCGSLTCNQQQLPPCTNQKPTNLSRSPSQRGLETVPNLSKHLSPTCSISCPMRYSPDRPSSPETSRPRLPSTSPKPPLSRCNSTLGGGTGPKQISPKHSSPTCSISCPLRGKETRTPSPASSRPRSPSASPNQPLSRCNSTLGGGKHSPPTCNVSCPAKCNPDRLPSPATSRPRSPPPSPKRPLSRCTSSCEVFKQIQPTCPLPSKQERTPSPATSRPHSPSQSPKRPLSRSSSGASSPLGDNQTSHCSNETCAKKIKRAASFTAPPPQPLRNSQTISCYSQICPMKNPGATNSVLPSPSRINHTTPSSNQTATNAQGPSDAIFQQLSARHLSPPTSNVRNLSPNSTCARQGKLSIYMDKLINLTSCIAKKTGALNANNKKERIPSGLPNIQGASTSHPCTCPPSLTGCSRAKAKAKLQNLYNDKSTINCKAAEKTTCGASNSQKGPSSNVTTTERFDSGTCDGRFRWPDELTEIVHKVKGNNGDDYYKENSKDESESPTAPYRSFHQQPSSDDASGSALFLNDQQLPIVLTNAAIDANNSQTIRYYNDTLDTTQRPSAINPIRCVSFLKDQQMPLSSTNAMDRYHSQSIHHHNDSDTSEMTSAEESSSCLEEQQLPTVATSSIESQSSSGEQLYNNDNNSYCTDSAPSMTNDSYTNQPSVAPQNLSIWRDPHTILMYNTSVSETPQIGKKNSKKGERTPVHHQSSIRGEAKTTSRVPAENVIDANQLSNLQYYHDYQRQVTMGQRRSAGNNEIMPKRQHYYSLPYDDKGTNYRGNTNDYSRHQESPLSFDYVGNVPMTTSQNQNFSQRTTTLSSQTSQTSFKRTPQKQQFLILNPINSSHSLISGSTLGNGHRISTQTSKRTVRQISSVPSARSGGASARSSATAYSRCSQQQELQQYQQQHRQQHITKQTVVNSQSKRSSSVSQQVNSLKRQESSRVRHSRQPLQNHNRDIKLPKGEKCIPTSHCVYVTTTTTTATNRTGGGPLRRSKRAASTLTNSTISSLAKQSPPFQSSTNNRPSSNRSLYNRIRVKESLNPPLTRQRTFNDIVYLRASRDQKQQQSGPSVGKRILKRRRTFI